MLLFLKKKNGGEEDGAAESARKNADKGNKGIVFSLSEFIPYYCHYNAHTLLTKNGELLQTIKIAADLRGLDYEGGIDEEASVREAVRQAIMGSIPGDAFSLWLHTIRKRRPIDTRATFTETYPAYVQEQWQRKNRWKYQYYNEIYVTVLHEGQSAAILDKTGRQRSVLAGLNRHYRNEYLDAAAEALESVVDQMTAMIGEHFEVTRLSLVERAPPQDSGLPDQPVFYSEPMEFLGTLVNLRTEPYALTEADLSAVLPGKSLNFGFNALETRNEAGKRRFAAMLAMKQYRELPLETVDRMLQASMEFIISQSFSFVPAKKALKQYKEQKDYFDCSGDTYAIEASGINDMLQSQTGHPVDFCEHQTSIMVMVDEYKHLDAEVTSLQDAFPEIGLIMIREDIKLEESFWAQLPGNFEFIRRRSPLNTARVGGFCRLNRFSLGRSEGNHWGEAVGIIPTMVNSPYFFNFHQGDNGHTLIFDCNSFHDHAGAVLVNFLLSQTRKYNGKLTVFDLGRSTRLLMNRLGGQFHIFPTADDARGQKTLRLNPFTLESNPRNHAFLAAWCGSLISPDARLDDAGRATLLSAIGQLYALPPEERRLATLAGLLMSMDEQLAGGLIAWQKRDLLTGLFDGAQETLDMSQRIMAFDMLPAIRRPECVIPVFSYLLHRVILALDGSPSIIVLHDAWDMLENPFFAPRLESLLDMLRQNNVAVIFTTRHPGDCADTHVLRTLMGACATRIYVPSDVEMDYAALGIGLDENDAYALWNMKRQQGGFLLRQGGESIGLQADLSKLDDIYAVFANDSKSMLLNAST